MMLSFGRHRHDVAFRALVMGVVEVASSRGSANPPPFDLDACCRRAERLVADGADVLDVGAVGPRREPEVGEAEELDRVVPAVEALHARFDVALSCATGRAAVVRAAFAAGAVGGHDASGFVDPDFLPAAVAAGASVIATRSPAGPPSDSRDEPADLARALVEPVGRARAAGVPRGRILLGATPGPGTSAEQWLAVLRRPGALVALGHPVVISIGGPFVGDRPAGEAEDRASVAAAALAVVGGCRVLLAHDARPARRVADVLAAILAAGGRPADFSTAGAPQPRRQSDGR